MSQNPMQAPIVEPAPPPGPILPDPAGFDPVSFPGSLPGEAWPPPRFDFQAAALREAGLGFERDMNGVTGLVRHFANLRMLVDVERAHALLDIEPASRDGRLLRLIPAALRCVDRIAPGDPMPNQLLAEDPEPPAEHHLYAATTELVAQLATMAGDEGRALSLALRRVPPGPSMFESAIAHCVTEDGLPMATLAPLARRLQSLANAHARVLAAAATQPDFAAMERMLRRTHSTLCADRRWAGDLLTRALEGLVPQIDRPRRTAAVLLEMAQEAMRQPLPLGAPTRLILLQENYRDRLLELAVFWRRLVGAWIAVDPQMTDRRQIEGLARNALRRLALVPLYRTNEADRPSAGASPSPACGRGSG